MTKRLAAAGVVFLLANLACSVSDTNAGPTQTANWDVDRSTAETVRADVQMTAGKLHVQGGGTKLLTGSFRYSDSVGRPVTRSESTGSQQRIAIESPNSQTSLGRSENEWNLQFGSDTPIDMNVSLKAGEADLDLSHVPLQKLEVRMAAGQLQLNLAGTYPKDLPVQVSGGAGETKIRLPRQMGVVVDATVGIGGINANGFSKRDGKYYNDAYAEGKPAIRVHAQGGVGEITLILE
jgi:hypothetical protein